MADRARGRTRAAGRSAWEWLVDFVIGHIPAIVTTLGSAAMIGLAAFSSWLREYGPVSWGAVGIGSFLLIAAGWWILALAQRVVALTRFARKREERAEINPLEDHFSRRQINISDFFHPFYEPTVAAKFQDCELYGPAVILALESTFLNTVFNQCEAVIIKKGVPVIGAAAFQNCTFERCRFYRVTLLVSKEEYLVMRRMLAGRPVPVISDGMAGDL